MFSKRPQIACVNQERSKAAVPGSSPTSPPSTPHTPTAVSSARRPFNDYCVLSSRPEQRAELCPLVIALQLLPVIWSIDVYRSLLLLPYAELYKRRSAHQVGSELALPSKRSVARSPPDRAAKSENSSRHLGSTYGASVPHGMCRSE